MDEKEMTVQPDCGAEKQEKKPPAKTARGKKTAAAKAEAAVQGDTAPANADTAAQENTAPAKDAGSGVTVHVPAASEVPAQVDPHTIVIVRNGFQGKLIYQSKKTGEVFEWDGFGAEQEMELGELRNAKSSSKRFFQDNWFMFDEPWVVEYLGVSQFYRYAIPIDGFDDLFEKTPEEIERIATMLSDGQRRSVAYRARQLIEEGGIDSNKVIAALERCLGTPLTDRDR